MEALRTKAQGLSAFVCCDQLRPLRRSLQGLLVKFPGRTLPPRLPRAMPASRGCRSSRANFVRDHFANSHRVATPGGLRLGLDAEGNGPSNSINSAAGVPVSRGLLAGGVGHAPDNGALLVLPGKNTREAPQNSHIQGILEV